jgi:cytochrome P450
MTVGSHDRTRSSGVTAADAGPLLRIPTPFVASGKGAGGFVASLKYRIPCYILSHMAGLKLAYAVLRVVRPVLIIGKVAVVTKASDVREVLERFDDFVLSDSIEPGMPWGPFLMTVDWRDQHARERRMLQSAVEPAADLLTIRNIAADVCRSQLKAAENIGRIDVVADLAEPVMVEIFKKYIGVPPLGGDPRRMAAAMRHLAGIIMVDPAVGTEPWIKSRADISDLTQQLVDQLATEAATADAEAGADEPPLPDSQTLFARLVRRHRQSPPDWFDHDWIRRYLTGLVATGGATIVRATAHAVDQLLAHPDGLRRAQALSGALDRVESGADPEECAEAAKVRLDLSRDALRKCIYEALRFRPMLPLLVRDCPRDTIIANGTKRARLVPAGTRVIAPPLAAMFDPVAFPDPSRFQERPIESYFHFGFGPRRCFGKYIADIALLEVVHALMRLPGLARAAGRDGQVGYEGPAPNSLVVTFEPRHPGAAR